VQRRRGWESFVYFGESGGDDEHERALAGGERDAELALWGQHVIEGQGQFGPEGHVRPRKKGKLVQPRALWTDLYF
jgi:hypothetical protein